MRLICPGCEVGLKVPDSFDSGKCPRCKAAIGPENRRPESGPAVPIWALGGVAGLGVLVILAGLVGVIMLTSGKTRPTEVAVVDLKTSSEEPTREVNPHSHGKAPPTKPDRHGLENMDDPDEDLRLPEVKPEPRLPEQETPEEPAPVIPSVPEVMPPKQPAPPDVIQPVKPVKEPPANVIEPIKKVEPPRYDEARFLGVLAKGKRFCIIADCSGSMSGNAIVELRNETSKTLRSLDPSREFYVIFYHSVSVPMPHPTWLTASKPNVQKVLPFVEGIKSQGGTQPSTAFTQAFGLQPRPDVIFFMTDGLIPTNVPKQVADLNAGKTKVPIHTIMFTRDWGAFPLKTKGGANPKVDLEAAKTRIETMKTRGEVPLRLIAEQSGGTFRHVTGK